MIIILELLKVMYSFGWPSKLVSFLKILVDR